MTDGNLITGSLTLTDAATEVTNSNKYGDSSGAAYGPSTLTYTQTNSDNNTAITSETDNEFNPNPIALEYGDAVAQRESAKGNQTCYPLPTFDPPSPLP